MRPAHSRDTGRRAQIARVRSQLRAHVDWLRGFPLSDEGGRLTWLVLPPNHRETEAEITVDRMRLSETARCVRELVRDHREALEAAVGDVDRWAARVLAAGARWKGCVHDGTPIARAMADVVADAVRSLPAGVGRRARAALADEAVRPLVESLLVARAIDDEPLDPLFAAIAQHRARLAAILAHGAGVKGRLAAFALLAIVGDDGARADALVELVDAALAADAVTSADRFVDSFPLPMDKGTEVAVRPAKEQRDRSSDAILACLVHIGRLDTRARRTALSLVSLTAPLDLLRSWGDAEAKRRAIDARARTKRMWDPRSSIFIDLAMLKASLPPSWELSAYTDAITRFSEAKHADLVEPLLRVLGGLRDLPGATTLTAARYLAFWFALLGMLGEGTRRRVPVYLAAFADFVAALPRDAAEERLSPWSLILFDTKRGPRWFDGVEDDALEDLERPDQVAAFFAILAGCTVPQPLHVIDVCCMWPAPIDVRKAIDLVDALVPYADDHSIARDALRVAGDLAPEDAKAHAALAAVLSGSDLMAVAEAWTKKSRIARVDDATKRMLRKLVIESPRVLTRWACASEIADAHELVLPSSTHPQPASGATPAWVAQYPEALRPALTRLASSDPDAEQTAARILSNDFRSEASLREEIAAIEAREDALPRSMDRRLANLRARLASPSAPSKGRLANLAKKIDRAAERAHLARTADAIDDACARAVARILALDACPAWARDDVALRILAAALRLDAPHRALAIRLFRVRAGPPPWDLRDAEENVEVIRTLEARGIDPRPWIDGIGIVEATVAASRVICLSLEDDPLEIFQMGERFGSCLSIGGGNYFSVFANAADIDKRVLYARERDGNVVGRCLLALDGEGHVVSFQVYARTPCTEDELTPHVASFARELAARMGTVCAPSGRVRARVAREWYDDGTRDLAQQFPFLANGSPFTRALEAATPADVTKLVATAFAPRPLDAITLPLVLSLQVLDCRPDLALPLIVLLEKLGGPRSDALRVVTARLAHDAGDVERARALAGNAVFTELEAGLVRQPDHVDQRLIDLALALDPSAVLAVVRRVSKRERTPGWDRVVLVRAEALERLGRPRRALALLKTLSGSWLEASVRQTIARIERDLAKRRPRTRRVDDGA